jgi:hypothetical protein
MCHCMRNTYRIALVLDLAGAGGDPAVVTGHKVIQILVVVDGHDGMPQTPRRALLPVWPLDRTNAQAVAQEQLLIERGYSEVSLPW